MDTPALERAITRHRQRWGDPEVVARSPGRVNLIGEHTDYNAGFCLPMALEFDTVVALSSTGEAGARVTIDAEGFGTAWIDPSEPARCVDWARHVAGVVVDLAAHGVESDGWFGTITTDIPIGAGLSSSAAVEVAVTTALLGRAGDTWSALDIARVGQRVENEFVGIPSGIMDQLISASARADHAGLMDCRALTLDHTPLPDGLSIAVLDTMTRRTLADGAYGDRRQACERAAASLRVPALRDVELDDVERIENLEDRRRARHVVTENARTVLAARALRAGDREAVGRLMVESHRSLRVDFEVSGPGLDAIVGVATRAPGCHGARMTGGGFAGCAVAAVESDAIDAFTKSVVDGYRYGGHTARVWVSSAAPGASLVGPP